MRVFSDTSCVKLAKKKRIDKYSYSTTHLRCSLEEGFDLKWEYVNDTCVSFWKKTNFRNEPRVSLLFKIVSNY